MLAEGFGDWDGTVVNPSNTQRRDVQIVRPAQDANTPAFIVLQWTQDNPAIWPFHCQYVLCLSAPPELILSSIAWHSSGGLYINILERPADIQTLQFPSSVADTCSAWSAWTGNHVPDQVDSGI